MFCFFLHKNPTNPNEIGGDNSTLHIKIFLKTRGLIGLVVFITMNLVHVKLFKAYDFQLNLGRFKMLK